MKDQVDTLLRRGASATFINSSLSRSDRESRYASLRRGEYGILFVTPERFRKPEFLEAIAGRTIRLLAVDEAIASASGGTTSDLTTLEFMKSAIGWGIQPPSP